MKAHLSAHFSLNRTRPKSALIKSSPDSLRVLARFMAALRADHGVEEIEIDPFDPARRSREFGFTPQQNAALERAAQEAGVTFVDVHVSTQDEQR